MATAGERVGERPPLLALFWRERRRFDMEVVFLRFVWFWV